MNEENNNVVPENGTIDNTVLEKTDNIENNKAAVIAETSSITTDEKNTNHHEDVSKVKIRTILRQRFKNSSPILKKVIPLVLVGIICFAAGLIAGRGIDRHRNERFLMNRNGMFRQMPGNFNGGNFNRRQFNNNNNNNNKQPNAKVPQTPKAPPAATN